MDTRRLTGIQRVALLRAADAGTATSGDVGKRGGRDPLFSQSTVRTNVSELSIKERLRALAAENQSLRQLLAAARHPIPEDSLW